MRGPGEFRQLARQNGQPTYGTDLVITNVVAALAATLALAAPPDEALRARALGVLRGAVAAEERWVKVHAAEALLVAGDGEADRGEVALAFDRELAAKGSEPRYRIGVWRVLAEAARDDHSREPSVFRRLGGQTRKPKVSRAPAED